MSQSPTEAGRPCRCDNVKNKGGAFADGDCRLCWLWHDGGAEGTRYRAGWAADRPLPEALLVTFEDLGGCPDVAGLQIIVTGGPPRWALWSACYETPESTRPLPTACSFTCDAFAIDFGAGVHAAGPPVAFRRAPFLAQFVLAIAGGKVRVKLMG